jgi:hypothetical protein
MPRFSAAGRDGRDIQQANPQANYGISKKNIYRMPPSKFILTGII